MEDLKLEHLNTFRLAATSLNFTSTARQLHLSQSAVSQQIRELEQRLGVALFERRGRGLLLSPAGSQLLRRVGPILSQLRRLRAEMGAFQGLAQGVLRLGASPTPGVYLLPHALGAFSSQHPGVQLTLSVAPSERTLRALHEGELDLAVVEHPPGRRQRGWLRESFFIDEVVLIVPPEHRWAGAGPRSAQELADEPLILRQQGSRTRQRILDHLATAGVPQERLRVRFELGHTEALIQAVMAGLGVGFVSRLAVATQRYAGLICQIELPGVRMRRRFWLLRPPAEKAFVHQERFCELLARRDWLPPELN